ncbi:DUF3037 domain-containing protein [Accumulibacter sp.]|uniref:DUF3037 domain-containing protein n=2 Tax=Candidatus Accumulibacter TaxID=327159 RepID=UPI0035ADF407
MTAMEALLAAARVRSAADGATMNEFACQYALLRFRPFAETGEFANVGVVLLAAEAGFFDFRLLKRYGRIMQFFYPFDREIFVNGRELFKEELQRFASDLRRDALDGARREPNLLLASKRLAELVRSHDGMFYFDQQRFALCDDPATKLDALYDHYCERNFVSREF